MASTSPDTLDSIRLFLDGQFTTVDSLELAEELLRDEERAHELLETELNAARSTTARLIEESKDIAGKANSKSAGLLTLHSDIAGSCADESSAAWHFRDGTDIMKLVESLAAELQVHERLGKAKVYVDLAVDIEQTRDQAMQQISKSPQSALAAYSHIVELLSKYEPSGAAAEAACKDSINTLPPHMLAYVKEVAQGIWDELDKAAAETQSDSLRKLGWPGKMDLSSGSVLGAFCSSFTTLTGLDLITRSSERILGRHGMRTRGQNAPPLPLEHMARAVDIRMRYHFESARQTNRADKPEWWLSQILATLRSIVPFLEDYVQRLYDVSGLPSLDVRNKFIELVLPVVRRKLSLDRPAYLDDGLIISHVARELCDFDRALREVYFFDDPSVLEEFLGESELFGAWVEAERKSAIESYMDTIRDPGALELLYDDEVLGIDDAKPSLLSEKVVQLVEDITERYSVVPSCMQRLQFLSATQFPIVIAMVEDMEAEIDEFNRISLAFIRESSIGASVSATSPGSNSLQSPLVTQLKRLAVWYQAVWFVSEAIAEWNNSAAFVDMWAAVCRHADALGNGADPRDWRDDCESWGERDRAVLDAYDQQWTDDDEWLDGGIWERSIGTFKELRQRVLDLMSRTLNKDAVGQLRAYRKKDTWASDNYDPDINPEISAELGAFLPELSAALPSLATLVPPVAFTRILRLLAAELDAFLVGRVATAHCFNFFGGRQFLRDVNAISQVLNMSGSRTNATSRILLKAKECALILACEPDSSLSANNGVMPLSLSDWGHAILSTATDESEAKLLLDKLGIKHLPLKDVRQLVNRRSDFADRDGDGGNNGDGDGDGDNSLA